MRRSLGPSLFAMLAIALGCAERRAQQATSPRVPASATPSATVPSASVSAAAPPASADAAEPARDAGATVALTRGAAATCADPFGTPVAPKPTLEAWPELPLSELARTRVLPGGFNTSGFISRQFVPAPCPPKAL